MNEETEINIMIDRNGNVQGYAISLLEDLWHDYLFFRKQAELSLSSEKLLLNKRYVRAAILLLMSYLEAVSNRWCSFLMKKQEKTDEKIESYIRNERLIKKCRFISEEAKKLDPTIGEPIIVKMKVLRDELVHLKGGNDWYLFNETSLENLLQTESNITSWMDTVEKTISMPRHPITEGLLGFLSDLGETQQDESSKP